jgi:cytochrome c553
MSQARPILFLLAAVAVITATSFFIKQPEPAPRKPAAKMTENLTAPEVSPVIPMVTAEMKDGKVLFEQVCSACHGMDGGGKAELKSPAIASLPEYYAKNQIASFREGRRGHHPEDTQSFLMGSIAKQLTAAQAEAVITHLTKMPRTIPAEIEKDSKDADLANGMMLFQERCMECHRYNASGEIAFASPPLIGQQAWYLTEQIHKFKDGRRGTVKGDVNGAKMVLSSNFIEDKQTLRDIVAYIVSLNPKPEGAAVKDESPFESASR